MKSQTIRALGLDLGVRNSLAAVWGDHSQTISLGEGELAIPTGIVSYNGEWLYGDLARQAYESGEESVINIRKELQGIFMRDEETEGVVKNHLYEWLLYILKEAEYRVRHSGFSLGITVPYSYLNPSRKALMETAQRTGVSEAILIHELLACAIAWRLRSQASSKPQKAILMSLGAGFTEAAAATISNSEIRILKSFSDPEWEGGDQCDFILCEHILDEMSKNGFRDIDQTDDSQMVSFVSKVEKTRRLLSRRHTARLAGFIGNRKVEMEINRDQINQWISPYVDNVERLAKQALERLEGECDLLLLSGGMSETPILLDRISGLVETKPTLLPQDSPAVGAAYMAHHFTGDRVESAPAIADAIAHSLHLVIPGGKDRALHPLIGAGDSLDFRMESVTKDIPLASRSEKISVDALQGESFSSMRHYHARFKVSGAQADSAGIRHIEMNLQIDHNGVFACSFRDKISRRKLDAREIASQSLDPRIKEEKIIQKVPARKTTRAPQEFPSEEVPHSAPEKRAITDKASALLLKRSFACIEGALQKRGVGYEIASPRQADSEDFSWDRFDLAIFTSSSQFDRYQESISRKLESFVRKGGRAFLLDWASLYMIKSFPGYLTLHEETHNGMAAYVEADVLDEGLKTTIGSRVNIDLSTGAWDPIQDISRPEDIKTLLAGSYEARNSLYQENKPLAVSFAYGKGGVLFSVLNEESFFSSTGLKLLDFFLDHILS